MNETILRALMQLFAISASLTKDIDFQKARNIAETYLSLQFNQELVDKYLLLFDKYCHSFSTKFVGDPEKELFTNHSITIKKICKQIIEGLTQKDKFIILIRLLEFVFIDKIITDEENDFIETVAQAFNISGEEFENTKLFVFDRYNEISDKNKVLIIHNEENPETDELTLSGSWFERHKPTSIAQFRHIYNEYLEGKIAVLFIGSINMLTFRYYGSMALNISGHPILPERTSILDAGNIIKGRRISPVYYSDVAGKFLQASAKSKIVFTVENLEFHFNDQKIGIQNFSLSEESGQMIGIMGGSGVGKSTLMNLLNGKFLPTAGRILINNIDLNRDRLKLEGIIGYVPQDDLLMEELTVFQNLYYNAKLCFSNFNDEQIIQRVDKILADLDLSEIKNLPVGNIGKRIISGGQRKRLNIALELIREPSILFVDEPTSGLSSMDSEMVMLLLKELTLKGKLVVVNIHQPSSEIYKLFDKLLVMDKGGYVIYTGNPIDALEYFKTISSQVDAAESECSLCGNVNPDQVLHIIESKVVDEYGKYTTQRKISPAQWYQHYKQNIESKFVKKESQEQLPKILFRIPDLFGQFKIFCTRDILAKISNHQYLLITFLEAPILAMILGYFTKYISGSDANPHKYIFSENVNLPAYLFMAVVVALFLGLIVSAEEIIADRKILERESFLNLSRFAYLNSKIMILFLISAIQIFTFVAVGNYILEIKGMLFYHFIILFSTACWANIVGLNISSGLNSVVNIYILIPFILVPELLLSGTIVNFDKLHENIASDEYVPFVGDLMISRWAFEAMAVTQFKFNEYERNFFYYEKEMSEAAYKQSLLIPDLESRVDLCVSNLRLNKNKDEVAENLFILKNEIKRLQVESEKMPFGQLDLLTASQFNQEVAEETKGYLEYLKLYFRDMYSTASNSKDIIYKKLIDKFGEDEVFHLKQLHYNKSLASMVLNENDLKKTVLSNHKLIRKKDPVFMYPQSNFGRAHFYAPVKKLRGEFVDTLWFNVTMIWLYSLFFYMTLNLDVMRRFVDFVEKLRFNLMFRKASGYLENK